MTKTKNEAWTELSKFYGHRLGGNLVVRIVVDPALVGLCRGNIQGAIILEYLLKTAFRSRADTLHTTGKWFAVSWEDISRATLIPERTGRRLLRYLQSRQLLQSRTRFFPEAKKRTLEVALNPGKILVSWESRAYAQP